MAFTKVNPDSQANVYVLKSTKTDYVYYGSTQRPIDERFEDHASSLKFGRHFNAKLQFLYNAGIRDWAPELVEVVASKEAAREIEKDLARADANALNVLYRHVQNRNSTITAETINLVKQFKAAGMKQYNIAKLANITGCSVSKIVNGMYDHKLED